MTRRLSVFKTYKLYIGGQFPRSESGRTFVTQTAEGHFMANIAQASRKDFRMAAEVARKAFGGWSARSAFNRGQILYRMAEMLESRRASFEEGLIQGAGYKAKAAQAEVDEAIDRLVWYAGWCDKFQQILGSTNPVATPHFNFSTPEPVGVVGIFASKESPLLGLVSTIAPVILSGNTCVVISESAAPTVAIDFSEVLATSDLPAGVVNILTGFREELIPHLAGHMDVDAVLTVGASLQERQRIEEAGADSLKRPYFIEDGPPKAWLDADRQSPYLILPFVEIKTAWHPISF